MRALFIPQESMVVRPRAVHQQTPEYAGSGLVGLTKSKDRCISRKKVVTRSGCFILMLLLPFDITNGSPTAAYHLPSRYTAYQLFPAP
jgi:hypothetical protein